MAEYTEYTPFASLDLNNLNEHTTGYHNTVQTITKPKNDCSGGIVGSSVMLTANAKQFVSPISIADANLQATSWLNANAQAYANNIGICKVRTTAWRGINPTCVIEPTPTLLPFDYMVITYKWSTKNKVGLITHTTFLSTGTEYDGLLGYSANGKVIPKNAQDATDSYMMRSDESENQYKKDTYLVNFKKLTTDFPILKTVQVKMGCYWSSGEVATENLEIEITTYKGGTMNKVGYDMINTGGNQIQQLIFSKNIPWSIREYTNIGYITYAQSSTKAEVVITY